VRPPDPFTSRPATLADAAEVAAVFNACEQAYSPEPARIGEREIGTWLDRAAASIVVIENGDVVAAGRAMPRGDALSVESVVLPEATGRGLGSFLLDWWEEQAREQRAGALRVSALEGDERAKELLAARRYVYIRSFYRMLIDLTEPPPHARWPAGVTVASLKEDEELLLYEAIEESFAEHWGHVPRSFEDWRRGLILEHDLTFLARDGAELAGAVVCNEDLFGAALVGILGVRKPWRGRGLGRALLLQGFGALYDRGKRTIGLGVDAGNETGALELYKSVGMRVGGQDDVYERRM
jgi:mycothiol synthase